MKKSVKIILIAVAALVACLVAFIAIFIYNSDYRPNDVASFTSEDGKYHLDLQQIGTPEFPFGSTKIKVVLRSGNKKISVYNGKIANDGKNVDESNFSCEWSEDEVLISLIGEEQPLFRLMMALDGSDISEFIDLTD